MSKIWTYPSHLSDVFGLAVLLPCCRVHVWKSQSEVIRKITEKEPLGNENSKGQ